jgi:hypothetical protein
MLSESSGRVAGFRTRANRVPLCHAQTILGHHNDGSLCGSASGEGQMCMGAAPIEGPYWRADAGAEGSKTQMSRVLTLADKDDGMVDSMPRSHRNGD